MVQDSRLAASVLKRRNTCYFGPAAMSSDQSTVRFRWPVGRPLLPELCDISEYVRQADATRIYTNFGPLVCEFEARLADLFGVPHRNVVTVNNCTTGLVLALRAQTAQWTGDCFVPGWTYVATTNAVEVAGFQPRFVDVNPETWTMEPQVIEDADGPCNVITVSPFGAPVNVDAWAEFANRTNSKVVIDAATAFDAVAQGSMVHPSGIPLAISFHATKSLGIGEGGCVVTTDTELADLIRAMANNGFDANRRNVRGGMNAKLSELQAAVGLAALDKWPARRTALQKVTGMYRRKIEQIEGVSCQPGFGDGWVSGYCCVHVKADADTLITKLASHGVEARKWWGNGVHNVRADLCSRPASLPETEELSSSVIGLPFYVDMAEDDVDGVLEGLRRALEDAA